MTISTEELGRRLKTAREACHLSQEEVARHMDASRPTVAQIELGNRAVSSLELDRLAYLFGRDIRELLADEFHKEDALVALFRRHPDASAEKETFAALRECVVLGREITNLERMLGIARDLGSLPSYTPNPPQGKWDAIQQGERVANQERRRLGLGLAPLPNLAGLLETQGVRTAQACLPEEISGLTLMEVDLGILVVANIEHHFWRRRFSFAHEYCHVLLDRNQRGTISRASDRDSLPEVRANSFAATFLMPREGVQEFVAGLAKGRPSRLRAEVFDEQEALSAQARPAPGSQAIQLYDVVLLAHHFGVSRISALYRLKNLKIVTEPEFNSLVQQDEGGLGKTVAGLLDLPEPDHGKTRDEFRHRFLALGLEAFRRGEITRAKLRELGAMVDVAGTDLDEVLAQSALNSVDSDSSASGADEPRSGD